VAPALLGWSSIVEIRSASLNGARLRQNVARLKIIKREGKAVPDDLKCKSKEYAYNRLPDILSAVIRGLLSKTSWIFFVEIS